MMKKFFKFSAAVILPPALMLVGVSAFALSGSETIKSVQIVNNRFRPAEIGIAVQENGNENEAAAPDTFQLQWESSSDGLYEAKKEVTVFNSDSQSSPAPAFIRVCLIPRWVSEITDEDGTVTREFDVTNFSGLSEMGELKKKISDNSYTFGDVTFTLDENWADNWIYNDDGYFYCRKSVSPGSSTPLLLKSVKINKEKYSYIISQGLNLKVDVISDSIQTEGMDSGEVNALEQRWGTPSNLGIAASFDAQNDVYVLKEYTDTSEDAG